MLIIQPNNVWYSTNHVHSTNAKWIPTGNDGVDDNHEEQHHYHPVAPFFLCVLSVSVTFQTGSVITVSSDATWHSVTWQFLKPATTPPSTPKISISNWQMDGLMVYKMIHPSQGLNGVREHHSVWQAFLEPGSHDLCVTGYSTVVVFFFPALKQLFQL